MNILKAPTLKNTQQELRAQAETTLTRLIKNFRENQNGTDFNDIKDFLTECGTNIPGALPVLVSLLASQLSDLYNEEFQFFKHLIIQSYQSRIALGDESARIELNNYLTSVGDKVYERVTGDISEEKETEAELEPQEA